MSARGFVVKNGLSIGNVPVINPLGDWLGTLFNLTGPQGAQGATGNS
jgi:hypothetical protein